jgi:hypothetical protein
MFAGEIENENITHWHAQPLFLYTSCYTRENFCCYGTLFSSPTHITPKLLVQGELLPFRNEINNINKTKIK